MRKIKLIAATFILLSGSCSKEKTKSANGGAPGFFINGMENDRACIQGVVRNGISGKRIILDQDEQARDGIYVLVHNRFISAKLMNIKRNEQNEAPESEETNSLVEKNQEQVERIKRLNGEFALCGIPVDESFPVFVWQDGFQAFEGVVRVASTLAQRTEVSDEIDIVRPRPTLLTDIDIYPIGVTSPDLKFNLFHGISRLANAVIQLQPTTKHLLAGSGKDISTISTQQKDDMFIRNSRQGRTVPLVATSDEEGNAVFSGDSLVLGGVYDYTIFPPEGGLAISMKKGSLTVGLRAGVTGEAGMSLTGQPFEVSVHMDRTLQPPQVVASSTFDRGFDNEGKIELWFDTEVEITAASEQGMGASVSGANGAILKDEGGKGAVSVMVEGRRMIIRPNWKESPDRSEEPAISVTYSNIVVRPRGYTAKMLNYSVSKEYLSVSIFDR